MGSPYEYASNMLKVAVTKKDDHTSDRFVHIVENRRLSSDQTSSDRRPFGGLLVHSQVDCHAPTRACADDLRVRQLTSQRGGAIKVLREERLENATFCVAEWARRNLCGLRRVVHVIHDKPSMPRMSYCGATSRSVHAKRWLKSATHGGQIHQ